MWEPGLLCSRHTLEQPDFLAALPQPVNVAIGQGVQRTGLADLHRGARLVMGVDRALIWAGGGLAVGVKLKMTHIVGKLVPLL